MFFEDVCIIFGLYLYVVRVEVGGGWVYLGEFEVFERLDRDDYSVFLDKSVLSLGYIPKLLVCRKIQEEFFSRMLSRGVAEGFLPSMVRVYGGTGCGKTVVVRSVLDRFSRYKKGVFRFFYVNLKQSRTVFSATNAILGSISGEKVAANLGVDRVFSKIWNAIRDLKVGLGKVFVCLVLDEADSVFADKHYDPSEFFYRFLRHQTYLNDSSIKVCLVVIANNAGVLEERLDGRVKSSMGSEMIHFGGYSGLELGQILGERALFAFKVGVVEEGVVELCAKVASEQSGDARKAIDLLRVSGEIANEHKSKVTSECVYSALSRVEKDYVWEMIEGLPEYMSPIVVTLAYLTLKEGKTTTANLYKIYNQTISGSGDVSGFLGERRILELVNELETIGLITTWNFSKGRGGYGKEIRLNISPQSILDFYKPNR